MVNHLIRPRVFPWLLALVALVAIPLSGCTSPPDALDPPGDPDHVQAASGLNDTIWENETYTGSITGVGAGITVDNMYLCCVSAHQRGEGLTSDFPVGANATLIVLELLWDDANFDLDLLVTAPDYEFYLPPTFDPSGPRFRDSSGFSVYAGGGTIGQPDNPVRVEIADPEALALTGQWLWEVRSKTAHEVAFELNVSVEYGPLTDRAQDAGA